MRRLVVIALARGRRRPAGHRRRRRRTASTYEVRAIFDNGSFLVPGEEVRIAGAKVGEIERGRRLRARTRSSPRGRQPPSRARPSSSCEIDDPGFQDFREDAVLLHPPAVAARRAVRRVRADPAARAGHRAAPGLELIAGRRARRGPVPAAARDQRQGRRPRPRQQHHAPALSGALPPDPQRARRRPRRPRRGARRDHRARQPGAARDRRGPRDPRRAEPARSPQLATRLRRGRSRRSPASATHSAASSTTPTRPPRPRPSGAPSSRPDSSCCPRFLRELRPTMTRARRVLRRRRRRCSPTSAPPRRPDPGHRGARARSREPRPPR